MARPTRPWWRPGPAAGRAAPALWLLTAAWIAGGVALWAGLSAKPWLVARRPVLLLEAFLGTGATVPQVVSFKQAVEGQPWCCEARYVDADEARREAGQDDRIRPLLDAYGANPFLRSFRVKLCLPSMESWHEAADWMKNQPGIVSVRAPSATAPKVLEHELLLLALIRGAAWGLGGFAALTALFALGSLAGNLRGELRVYAELGASGPRRLLRAVWALAAPSALIAAAVATSLELVCVLGRLGGVWTAGPLGALPDVPHTAGAALLGVALGLPALVGLFAAGVRRP
ncbi:MAG: permease-like cell division protein FtsX [Candidatus Coatesbacteria bacterium]